MSADPARTGRPPAHAGSFYPADRASLLELVDDLLEAAERRLPAIPEPTIVGAITPHAGFVYSGAVAATAWATIAKVDPATIILVGADHGGRAAGASVWTDGPWRLPAGEVPIDIGFAERIVALGPPFAADDAAHEDEHSIEVQLPFIARACPAARLVPVLIGSRSGDLADVAGAWLGRLVAGLRARGDRAVLVASSDLAHYPPAALAREVDERVLGPILRLDGRELGRIEAEIRSSGMPGVVCGACGLEAIRCVLAAAEEAGATQGSLLAEATSADLPGADPEQTVGYAAVALVA